MRSIPLLVLPALILWLGCGPEPVFDDDLGVLPVTTEPGALAGVFAQKSVRITLSEMPLFGEQLTGSEYYYLVEREWDPDEEVYRLRQTTCDGHLYDTVGGSSTISRDGWQANQMAGEAVLELDHAQGTYSVRDYVELWSVELDDPLEGEFPSDADAAFAASFSDQVGDGDDDGNPGVTLTLDGFIGGDVFFIQRRFGEWTGAVRSEDEIVGINDFSKNQIVLGATDDLLNNQLPSRAHPDPLESWFQEVRLDEGEGCAEVLDRVESRELSFLRPFGPDRE